MAARTTTITAARPSGAATLYERGDQPGIDVDHDKPRSEKSGLLFGDAAV